MEIYTKSTIKADQQNALFVEIDRELSDDEIEEVVKGIKRSFGKIDIDNMPIAVLTGNITVVTEGLDQCKKDDLVIEVKTECERKTQKNELNLRYKIIIATSPEDLVKRTNEKIKEGWAPQGGPVCDNERRVNHKARAYFKYSQAMTKSQSALKN